MLTEIVDENERHLIPTKTYMNIFALGDIALTSVNEEKTIYPLKQCAKIVAENIQLLASGEDALKSIPDRFAGIY